MFKVNDTDIYLTSNGKNEVKKWMKFKKFIEQYTLIEQSSIEDTQIWDKYIPYAMALDINRSYEEKILLFNKEEMDKLNQYLSFNKYGFAFRPISPEQEKNI